jgi:hypothetical protein
MSGIMPLWRHAAQNGSEPSTGSKLSHEKRRVWAYPGVFCQFGYVIANDYELA